VLVGAGVFGASLAHRLAGDGWEVTLVDQSPPAHERAASGGESRLIRYAHGPEVWYTRWTRCVGMLTVRAVTTRPSCSRSHASIAEKNIAFISGSSHNGRGILR
jgi:glycine/D-amino acid oxidase-like deaminating enzyme